jgi:hypothetical protein
MFSLNPVTKAWFWLLIISIIGLILTFIFFEILGQLSPSNTTTPSWIWIFFIVVVIVFIIALILFIIDIVRYYRELEIAEACGLLPPPCPKKIICPKQCIETKIVTCPDKDRCGNPIDLGPPIIVEQPIQKPSCAQPIIKPPCEQPVIRSPCERLPVATSIPVMVMPSVAPFPAELAQPLFVQPIPGQAIPVESVAVSARLPGSFTVTEVVPRCPPVAQVIPKCPLRAPAIPTPSTMVTVQEPQRVIIRETPVQPSIMAVRQMPSVPLYQSTIPVQEVPVQAPQMGMSPVFTSAPQQIAVLQVPQNQVQYGQPIPGPPQAVPQLGLIR